MRVNVKITSVNTQVETIDISGSYAEPDPDWVFVDAHGNEHRWAYAMNHKWHLPTLKHRNIPSEGERECALGNSPCPGALCDECDEFVYEIPGRSEYYVPETDEVVVPEYRDTMGARQFMPGLTTCDGEFESDEYPKVGGTYKLEDCEFPGTDETFHGDILITSVSAKIGGVCWGTWRASGEVTRAPPTLA